MLTIGCHLSSSKGYLAMGKEAVSIGANTFQFFTRNPRGSKAKAIDEADVAAFLSYSKEHGIERILAHAPYTLNPCSKDAHTREFAWMTMADDLKRMEYTPGNCYNFHPGSHTGQGAEEGVRLISEMLNEILKPEQTTTVLLETMAGKGTEVGRSFEELAAILEEFSNQMEQAADVTASWEEVLSGILRRSHLRVDNMLVLQYENQQKEAFLTLRSVNGRCMTARDVAELLGRAIAGSHWSVAKDSKSLITRNAATFRFVEEGKYRMVYGMACSPREGEPISGDTCTVQTGLPGQVIMSLSDGMGSGRSASEDSEKVIELTQRLLETGFSARSALKLVNTVLLLAGTEQNPATIDLCCIDLGTGVLEAMKLGAVPTFILGREGVEFLEAGGLPMGIVQNAEPVLMSRKMWDGEKIIMISDGILEAMPGEHKEETFMEFVSNLSGGNPQELAEQILAFASGLSDGGVVDDCTVLVGTVLERG